MNTYNSIYLPRKGYRCQPNVLKLRRGKQKGGECNSDPFENSISSPTMLPLRDANHLSDAVQAPCANSFSLAASLKRGFSPAPLRPLAEEIRRRALADLSFPRQWRPPPPPCPPGPAGNLIPSLCDKDVTGNYGEQSVKVAVVLSLILNHSVVLMD